MLICVAKIGHHSKLKIITIFFPQGSGRKKAILNASFKVLYFYCYHLLFQWFGKQPAHLRLHCSQFSYTKVLLRGGLQFPGWPHLPQTIVKFSSLTSLKYHKIARLGLIYYTILKISWLNIIYHTWSHFHLK